MAFDKALSRVPVAIRDLSVVLTDYVEDGEVPAHQEAGYEFQVEYNTGEIKTMQGNLVPHITTAQIEALQAFIAGLRVQAAAEILP